MIEDALRSVQTLGAEVGGVPPTLPVMLRLYLTVRPSATAIYAVISSVWLVPTAKLVSRRMVSDPPESVPT